MSTDFQPDDIPSTEELAEMANTMGTEHKDLIERLLRRPSSELEREAAAAIAALVAERDRLTSAEGREPFITVKGCRIVDGSKGAFVSWPATKNESSGKYWSHVLASEAFASAVLERAQESKHAKKASKPASKHDDFEDVPF